MLLSLYLCLVVISSLLLIYSRYLCYSNVDKERRGCFVEWVEKASFAQLNKLFKIDVVEWADSVLFSDKNLLALIKYPKPFIILVFPRLAPSSLVLSEHFVLKDLLFYGVARLGNSEVRQARLKERQKKHHKGTLRQAPVASCLSSSSVVRLFTQKKKTAARHVQRVRILPLASPSSSSASSSSSPSSLSYNDEPKAGVDWPVPSIICEKEKEEEKMASDLRVGFCER